MGNMAIQPVPSRMPLPHSQEPILVRQVYPITKVPLRDLFLAMHGCSHTQQLCGSHRRNRRYELRVARLLFPVKPLRFGEEGMAQASCFSSEGSTCLLR